jgi:hypothetical protein
VRVELYRPEHPETVVAVTRWVDGRPVVETEDDELRPVVVRMFRPTPVVVDDPALRYAGAHGESVLQPGSVEWFRTVALVRAPEEGLAARIVPEAAGGRGWDPAAAYQTFRRSVTRLVSPRAAGNGGP